MNTENDKQEIQVQSDPADGPKGQPTPQNAPAGVPSKAAPQDSIRQVVEAMGIDPADYPGPADANDTTLFCDARPKVEKPYRGIIEKFLNWARANSLWVLGFGTGCGAIELRPLMTSRFDASRFGVAGRPTPRQSSVFIIGGYASVKTLKRIVRSYNTINRIDQYIPVDVYITGCMPRPEAILAGFVKLQELIKSGRGEKANEYAEHFDWYKANQKKVITNWDMPDYNW